MSKPHWDLDKEELTYTFTWQDRGGRDNQQRSSKKSLVLEIAMAFTGDQGFPPVCNDVEGLREFVEPPVKDKQWEWGPHEKAYLSDLGSYVLVLKEVETEQQQFRQSEAKPKRQDFVTTSSPFTVKVRAATARQTDSCPWRAQQASGRSGLGTSDRAMRVQKNRIGRISRRAIVDLKVEYEEGPASRQPWEGVGFIVTNQGHVVTADHVVVKPKQGSFDHCAELLEETDLQEATKILVDVRPENLTGTSGDEPVQVRYRVVASGVPEEHDYGYRLAILEPLPAAEDGDTRAQDPGAPCLSVGTEPSGSVRCVAFNPRPESVYWLALPQTVSQCERGFSPQARNLHSWVSRYSDAEVYPVRQTHAYELVQTDDGGCRTATHDPFKYSCGRNKCLQGDSGAPLFDPLSGVVWAVQVGDRCDVDSTSLDRQMMALWALDLAPWFDGWESDMAGTGGGEP